MINLRTFDILSRLQSQMCVLRNGEEMAHAWTLDTKMCETRITKPDCVMPFTDRILY